MHSDPLGIEAARRHAREAQATGNGALAEQLLNQLLQADPQPADAVNLGALLRSQGRLKDAMQHYQHWLGCFPEVLPLRLNAINSAIEAGACDTALRWIREGEMLEPERLELQQARGRALLRAGRIQPALTLLQTLALKQPEEANAWLDLALAQHHAQQWGDALKSLAHAAVLQPDDPRPVANQLAILRAQGHWEAAEQLIQGLPAPLRSSREVRGAWADVLRERQDLQAAALEFAELCREEPQNPLHWLNHAACLRGLRRPVAAFRIAKRGFSLHPNHRQLRQTLAQSLTELGQQQRAMPLLLQDLDEKAREPLDQVALFNLQFLGAGYQLLPPEQLAALAQQWEHRVQQAGVGPLWGDRMQEPLEGRRLRVGYFSADLCNHPVGRFLLPILQQHERSRVEVIGLSCGPHRDAMQEALRAHCDAWVDLQHRTSLEGARIISDLQLDVVIELGGFTANSRLDMLCHRPARLQLSYLGYFAPTYLRCIDGWIGDSVLFATLSPLDQRQTQLQLAGGYMAYDEPLLPSLEPVDCHGPVRVGCFNHARKLTAETVRLFCNVMTENPGAMLVLKSVSFVETHEQTRVRELFCREGLDSERLRILPWVEGREAHLRCYQQIDLALDPIPYGGATTSCEALAMGVPVVTLSGPGMVRQLTSSILASSGCAEWIAADPNEFIRIATTLIQGGRHDLTARQRLRNKINASDLCNARRLSGELEQLLKVMVARASAASA